MIAPTEDGWQTVSLNRRITSDHATIIVTAKNTKPLKTDIKIFDTPDREGTIISLSNLRSECLFANSIKYL
jgi:hypothetical protein